MSLNIVSNPNCLYWLLICAHCYQVRTIQLTLMRFEEKNVHKEKLRCPLSWKSSQLWKYSIKRECVLCALWARLLLFSPPPLTFFPLVCIGGYTHRDSSSFFDAPLLLPQTGDHTHHHLCWKIKELFQDKQPIKSTTTHTLPAKSRDWWPLHCRTMINYASLEHHSLASEEII